LNPASPPVLEIAKQIVAAEIAKSKLDAPVPFRTIEMLSQRLLVPIGPSSLQSLLVRSLARSTAEVPWLGALRVGTGGTVEGLSEARATYSAKDMFEGECVVLCHFLQLLVSFIGPSLTLRFFRDTWPQIDFSYSDFGNANND
jgi:hypothetical protein